MDRIYYDKGKKFDFDGKRIGFMEVGSTLD